MVDGSPGEDRTASAVLPPAILVVDDNAAKRIAIRAMLAPLGHRVVEVDSGREALRAVLRGTFAVILMDVRMPTLDGYETAKLIRQRPQSELTPIIFVTAFGGDEAETATAYASGAVDFIFTPILPDVLRAKVSAFVDLFVQSEELQRSLESITDLNAALRASEVRARAVLQNVADGIVTAGEGGLIESFNRSARAAVRVSRGGSDRAAAAADRGAQPSRRILRVRAGQVEPAGREGDSRGVHARRSAAARTGRAFRWRWTSARCRSASGRSRSPASATSPGRKAYTEALEHRALHDELTGLPNRTLFADRVDRAIAFADRADESRAVLLVDLDKFREINETLGREKGDALLQAVAGRLRGAMRDSDTVGRLGGDSFGILPSGETDVEAAAAIAWKVRAGVRAPVSDQRRRPSSCRASIGIALFPQHGRSTADLLRRCRSGDARGQVVRRRASPCSWPTQRTRPHAGLTLLNDLRDGIPRGELVLHYQPKVDLTAGQRTTGVEALVRWQHPTEGLLMPAQFMPEAERSELIEPLTEWVLNEALAPATPLERRRP